MSYQAITFRPISEDDLDFLYQVYASTREAEMALLDWPDAEKEKFLRFQFEAQHQHYQEYFPKTQFDLILLNGQPIGRLYLDRRNDEFRIVDIALLTRYRGRGLGGKIMSDILKEAGAVALPVRIHVEQNNPALHLYHRLGFQKIEDKGIYCLMEWTPEA